MIQVGDWVVQEIGDGFRVGKIIEISNNRFLAKFMSYENPYEEYEEAFDFSEVRKASDEEIAAEKERRKWAAIGREVNDYHKGDIVMVKNQADVVDFVEIGPYLRGLKRHVSAHEIELICPVKQRFDKKEEE